MDKSAVNKNSRNKDILRRHPASFRDPEGYVFERDGLYYRRAHASWRETSTLFMESGCYLECVDQGLLLPHEDVSGQFDFPAGERVLQPEQLDCLSYPYEWSFSQVRAAALCTLDILRIALKHGLTLKDASGFNVTWHKGRMVFFDTLSFTPYREGEPWAAYGQFCRHFLAPLALMRYTDLRCTALFLRHWDGIPLDLAAKLLPWRTCLFPALALHIHTHAALSRRKANSAKKTNARVSRKTMNNLADSLRHAVAAMTPPRVKTEWGDYYGDTNYTKAQAEEKHALIGVWLKDLVPGKILDLGANDGTYSRLAARYAPLVLSLDMDPVAVDINVRRCLKEKDPRVVPLLADMTAPSPALGWNGEERASLFERVRCDCGLALALIHHLAIGNNVPLPDILRTLSRLAPAWIVEFVEKEDSQVRRLLRNRPDIFADYSREGFEKAVGELFVIEKRRQIGGTRRALYLLRKKD